MGGGTGPSGWSVLKVSVLDRSAALKGTNAIMRMWSARGLRKTLSGQSGVSVNLGSKREKNVMTVFVFLTQGCVLGQMNLFGQIGALVDQMVASQE